MSEAVTVVRRDGVLEVTLDRPPVNAIDIPTSVALGEAFAELRDDPDLRVGIITGGGEKTFCAGWDLKALDAGDMQLERWWEADYGPGGFAGLTELWDLHKPVIGALNGHAIGGGFELALACDLLLAASPMSFRLPELPLGMVPDAGAVQRLPRRLPRNVAMEMLYLGRWLTADEALAFGLVNAVADPAELMAKARQWADQIAAVAPLAVQAMKQVTAGLEGLAPRGAYDTLRQGNFEHYERMMTSEDAKEGVNAFVEKRDPAFKSE